MSTVSVEDLVKPIRQTRKGKVTSNSPSVMEGLRRSAFPKIEGYHVATPSQLLDLLVDRQIQNGNGITGYQRALSVPRARRIGVAIEAGEPLPPIHVSLWKDEARITDGQHRAVGAIIARKSIPVVVEKVSKDDQRKLFANQRKAVRPDVNLLILSADDPFSEYVQDAVTSNDSIWSSMVSMKGSNARITPNQMFMLIQGYVTNTVGRHGATRLTEDHLAMWDPKLADEAGRLVQVFGTKQTNPLAYRPLALSAIGQVMTLAIRRHERASDLIDRWNRIMPQFPFDQHMHLRTANQLADAMLLHWNKRLSPERKAHRG